MRINQVHFMRKKQKNQLKKSGTFKKKEEIMNLDILKQNEPSHYIIHAARIILGKEKIEKWACAEEEKEAKELYETARAALVTGSISEEEYISYMMIALYDLTSIHIEFELKKDYVESFEERRKNYND